MPNIPLHNLVKRHQTWSVRLKVPDDCLGVIGKSVLTKSTKQRDPMKAAEVAAPILAQWRKDFEHARLYGEQRERERAEKHLASMGRAATGASPEAQAIMLEHEYGIKLKDPHFTDYLDPWKPALAKQGMKPRQIDQYVADANRYGASDLRLSQATAAWTQAWGEGRLKDHGDSLKTLQRRLAALRNYWGFLRENGHVSKALPKPFDFEPPASAKAAKKAKGAEKREAFTPAEIVQLWTAAGPKSPLADVIVLAAHTGGRIEELFSIRLEDIGLDDKLEPATLKLDSKTDAGDRMVPVVNRPVLLEVLKRRMGEAAARGGFILPSTSKNQYGERSQAMGQKFGRLKTREGFPSTLVFHSIRKTVASLLHDAGCPEPIAADILGHKIATMSYGVYSAGSTMDTRREWLEKAIRYAFPQNAAAVSDTPEAGR